MPRYGFVEGASRRFWEISLSGKSFTVCFGRIGGEGRAQTKSFATALEAKAQYDKIVAEKVKKGYRLVGEKRVTARAKKTATPAESSPALSQVVGSIDDICTGIETYFDALRRGGFELFEEVILPHTPTEIADVERKLSTSLPTDVKHLLSRGLRAATGSIEEGGRFAGIGFDWLNAKTIVTSTTMLRKVAVSSCQRGWPRDALALTISTYCGEE